MPLPHPVELYAEVKKELQLDDAALEKLLDANERWPRSSKEDGWVMSHEAIRMDLRDLAASVEALSKTAAGSGLQSWQVSGLREMTREFIRQVTNHHNQEENIYFPTVLARIKLPEKVATDHRLLVTKLQELEAKAAALKGEGASAEEASSSLASYGESLKSIDSLLHEHLREEEVEILPRVRAAFTRDDMMPTIKAMHKGLAASDLGWLLRPRGTDEAKRAWLDGTSMPGLVVSLMIMPAVVGYGKEAKARLEELTEGKRREDGGGCCIA